MPILQDTELRQDASHFDPAHTGTDPEIITSPRYPHTRTSSAHSHITLS